MIFSKYLYHVRYIHLNLFQNDPEYYYWETLSFKAKWWYNERTIDFLLVFHWPPFKEIFKENHKEARMKNCNNLDFGTGTWKRNMVVWYLPTSYPGLSDERGRRPWVRGWVFASGIWLMVVCIEKLSTITSNR
jgi:hypothetical protein